MRLYDLHTEYTKLLYWKGKERIPVFAWDDMNDMLKDEYGTDWRRNIEQNNELHEEVMEKTEIYRDTFLKDALYAVRYARDVIRGRWRRAEDIIYADKKVDWMYDEIVEHFGKSTGI